ncbi:MAG: hypothetical protein ACREUG_04225 [Steroidobacteraceae bacterium]
MRPDSFVAWRARNGARASADELGGALARVLGKAAMHG